MVDEKLAAGRLDGYQYADMPDDRDTWRLVLRGLDETAASPVRAPSASPPATPTTQEAIVAALVEGRAARRGVGRAQRQARLVGVHARDPGRLLLPPVGVERDRLRRPGLPAGLHAPRADRASSSRIERPGATAEDPVARSRSELQRDDPRPAQGAVGPQRQRLALPARRPPPRSARRGHDGPLRRRRRGRPRASSAPAPAARCWPSAWPGAGGGS